MQFFQDTTDGSIRGLDDSIDVTIVDGVYLFSSIPGLYMDMPVTLVPIAPPPPTAPSKEMRIAALQMLYESDRDKLNKAWLSALIADGAGEATRKTIIESQMTDLDTQLEADILTIIMEE